jgi:hypothetical protein
MTYQQLTKEFQMSAYMVSDLHLNAIVTYASNNSVSVFIGNKWFDVRCNEQRIIAILETANKESLHVRYGDDDVTTGIKYKITDKYQSPMQIIKLCDCFNYQACEVNDYEHTPAAAIIKAIIHNAINNLPGYGDLEWSV